MWRHDIGTAIDSWFLAEENICVLLWHAPLYNCIQGHIEKPIHPNHPRLMIGLIGYWGLNFATFSILYLKPYYR